jgi:predicted tellurium resistance membrane protein TerC
MFSFDWVYDPKAWLALLVLTLMEIVLGIDNIIFISILADRLPVAERAKARQTGLALAMVFRIGLLLCISWVIRLTEPLFTVWGKGISGRDLILIAGGLFLLWKSTYEIHHKVEGHAEAHGSVGKTVSLRSVLIQIVMLDIVFSFDSVVTAVGMADDIPVMILAVILSVICMMIFAGSVSNFVSKHPTVKMLALSFLLLIGVTLIADGLAFHIPKGYVYFAMGFSLLVEMLNLRMSSKAKKA